MGLPGRRRRLDVEAPRDGAGPGSSEPLPLALNPLSSGARTVPLAVSAMR